MEISNLIIRKDIKSYYKAKAIDSFRTKLNLFLFNIVLNNGDSRLDLNEFISFEITKPLVDIYTTEYWQLESDHVIEQCGLTCDAIYNRIAQLIRVNPKRIEELKKHYIANRFPEILDFDHFKKLLTQDHCEYCKITIDEINDLADKRQLRKKNLRGWTLEIDRLDSNIEYKPDNCVMACYWCNNAKTDEFTADEFIEVGKAIRKIWDKRKECVEMPL